MAKKKIEEFPVESFPEQTTFEDMTEHEEGEEGE